MIRLQIIPESQVDYSKIFTMIVSSLNGHQHGSEFKSEKSGIKGEIISSEICFPDAYQPQILKSMDKFNGYDGFQIRLCIG